MYYRGCWHIVSRPLFLEYRHSSSSRKEVYTPQGFILHAESLGQTFVHCPRFPTAAPHRGMDRVSVPLRPDILSDRLPVIGLVSHYLDQLPDRPHPPPHANCFFDIYFCMIYIVSGISILSYVVPVMRVD